MGKFKDTMEEFKKFVFRGNVIDMAVGVVVGGAFSTIVNSLVNDIIMPLVGAIAGSETFAGYKLVIGNAEVMYGSFIQSIVNFLIIAVCVFAAIKLVNGVMDKFKEKEEPAPEEPAGPTTEELLAEIRDLLKTQNS